jgi:hypothetical protein
VETLRRYGLYISNQKLTLWLKLFQFSKQCQRLSEQSVEAKYEIVKGSDKLVVLSMWDKGDKVEQMGFGLSNLPDLEPGTGIVLRNWYC